VKIAFVAPSPVPFAIGGAENLFWALHRFINQHTHHQAELIKVPCRENGFFEIVESYQRMAKLDLSHFDLVVSGKYPSWMIEHSNHVCYMLHRLRGLYDTYASGGHLRVESCPHSGVRKLREFLARYAGERSSLDEFFGLVAALRGADVPPEVLSFPGPLIREIVHFLDGIGLDRGAVRRYAAISANLTQRANYFPEGVPVSVLHPPSHLSDLHCGNSSHLFTIGRLDGPKRIALLVQAMRRTRTPLHLKIAGTGPDEGLLRELVGDDPRIELLGFVNDAEVVSLYADALAVPYVPLDEDYGLVTFEAMASSKPVITTHDVGGPLEFVVDGENGLVTDPKPDALAKCIDRLCDDPRLADQLGRRARERVREVRWDRVVAGLLGERTSSRRAHPTARRRKIVVATTFPVFPPEGGGQVRVFGLYGEVARYLDVELVTLGQPDSPGLDAEIAPGLRELRVPPSPAHRRAERSLSRSLAWTPVTDVALPRLHTLTPDYAAALRRCASDAHAMVASHPYAFDAIVAAAPNLPLWFECQDVEVDLKRSVLPDSPAGAALLRETRRVEEACWRRSETVLVCSEDDASRLRELFGSRSGVVLVPNGVDTRGVAYISPENRAARKAQLGLETVPIAVFVGSWHPPNIDAVETLYELAPQVPHVQILVVGGVGGAFADLHCPPNLAFLGVVDPDVKEIVLAIADVALNPMRLGSGTNLKMLEYAAAGLPIITTRHGARGLSFEEGRHLCVVEQDDFATALCHVLGDGHGDAERRADEARRHVGCHYDWRTIAERWLRSLEKLGKLPG